MDNQILLGLLSQILAGGNSAMPNNPAQSATATPVIMPYGCTGILRESQYTANLVNDLNSWDEHVICSDGGTYKGLKVMFIHIKPTKKSDKSYSTRDGYIARFEVAKAGGRNPMNEIVNIFLKNENDYKPYLDPAKWAVKVERIEFRSEDESQPQRKFNLNMIYFGGELLSDSAERKADYLSKRVDASYACYIDGELYEGD